MLNEFKRPMWGDGFNKNRPWINYFNEYEQTHCCFGEADEDAPSVGEEALEQEYGYTVAEQRADAAGGKSSGGSGGSGGSGLSKGDFEDYEGLGGLGSHAAMEMGLAEGLSGLGTAKERSEAGDRAEASFGQYSNVEGTGFGGGYGGDGSFDIGLGYNDLVDLGYDEINEASALAGTQAKADELTEKFKNTLGGEAYAYVDEQGNIAYGGPAAFQAGFGEIKDSFSTAAGVAKDAYTAMSPLISPVAAIGSLLTGRGTLANIAQDLTGGAYSKSKAPLSGLRDTVREGLSGLPLVGDLISTNNTDFTIDDELGYIPSELDEAAGIISLSDLREDDNSQSRKRVKRSWTFKRKEELAKKLGKEISELTDKDYADNEEFDIVEETFREGGGVSFLGEEVSMANNNQKTITDSINILNQFAQTGTTSLMGSGNITPTPPMLPQALDREVATGGNNEDALRSLIMEDVASYGGGAVSGEGDGTSDEIEAVIQEDVVMAAGGGGLSALAGPSGKLDNYLPQVSEQGGQAARLSDGEFVIPADVVASIGNGSTAAGNKELYNLMSKVRKIKTGDADQPRDMPASPAELLGIG